MVFVRQDGSYIPVTAAVLGDYEGLVNRDLPVLDPAGFTITVRFEVNRSYRRDTPVLNRCTVAWVSTPRFPGELTDAMPSGG